MASGQTANGAPTLDDLQRWQAKRREHLKQLGPGVEGLTDVVVEALLANDHLLDLLFNLESKIADDIKRNRLRVRRRYRSHFLCWLLAGASRIVGGKDFAELMGRLAGECIKSKWVKRRYFQNTSEDAQALLADAVTGAVTAVFNAVANVVGGHTALHLAVLAVLVCPDPDQCPAAKQAGSTAGKALLQAWAGVEFGGH